MSIRSWTVPVLSALTLLAASACTGTAALPGASGSLSPVTPGASAPVSVAPSTPPPSPSTPKPKPTPTPTGYRAKPSTKFPAGWSDLANATVNLPSWGFGGGCPEGQLTLTNGWYPSQGGTDWHDGIGQVVAVDLDGDGRTEAVARFDCQRSDPGISQVVGFAHTAGGAVTTLGIVVGPGRDNGPTQITDMAVQFDKVIVTVDNLAGSAGSAHQKVIFQSRGYGWNGSSFYQNSGSASFITTASLSGKGDDMEFTPPAGGDLLGTMTITVKNNGSTPITSVSMVAGVGDTGLVAMDTPDCHGVQQVIEECDVAGPLAPGASASFGLRFNLASSDVDIFTGNGGLEGGDFFLQIRVGDQKTAVDPPFGTALLP